MWHVSSPRLDKILQFLVYILKTLGRLGQLKPSKYLNDLRTDGRFEHQSLDCRNLWDQEATVAG